MVHRQEARSARNIVVCCDGTGNEIEENISNVLKLFRVCRKSANQAVYYDPGIGTLGQRDPWARVRQNAKSVFSLATGYGLDAEILDAYRFLVDNHADGDRIYLFGFSRGAYTVRVLAGLVNMLGLLQPAQVNLCGYALAAYKQASGADTFDAVWRFQRIAEGRSVWIHFMGVWDTVSSVIVPRADRFFVPSLQTLPYTRRNPCVRTFRHAMAIDERRRMFRLNRWEESQDFVANPFDGDASAVPQDIEQVWFAGAHGDVGGGHPETESGLSKYPLAWMLKEALAHGLLIHRARARRMVDGVEENGAGEYVKPDPAAPLHNSTTWGWWPLEVLPKRVTWREWPGRRSLAGFYLPLAEPRRIPEGAKLHRSVMARLSLVEDYRPSNLPEGHDIVD